MTDPGLIPGKSHVALDGIVPDRDPGQGEEVMLPGRISVPKIKNHLTRPRQKAFKRMGSRRFELLTSAMSRRRHSQLDHEPAIIGKMPCNVGLSTIKLFSFRVFRAA
jgi:hypothetical protein